nr:MAG TPA: hypothetical protein [Bacteriophage sp.]
MIIIYILGNRILLLYSIQQKVCCRNIVSLARWNTADQYSSPTPSMQQTAWAFCRIFFGQQFRNTTVLQTSLYFQSPKLAKPQVFWWLVFAIETPECRKS